VLIVGLSGLGVEIAKNLILGEKKKELFPFPFSLFNPSFSVQLVLGR
jgi:molybdopterin/thiamine biosynthesis adenylyltransferase